MTIKNHKEHYKKFIKDSTKVNKVNGCWEWTKGLNQAGYGNIYVYYEGERITIASRLSFVVHGGTFTKDKNWALHSCDNPPCCNPAHLRAGDAMDNAIDRDINGNPMKGRKNTEDQLQNMRTAQRKRDWDKFTQQMTAATVKRLGIIHTPYGKFRTYAEARKAEPNKLSSIEYRVKSPKFKDYYRKKD